MKKSLIAVVLAAGSGSRFWPFSTNKVLFPFLGKPLFDYSVRGILPPEVTRVVVVASAQEASYYEAAKFSVPHKVVIQKEPRGMADAVLSAADQLSDTSLLIINGDDVYDETLLSGVLGTAKKSQAQGVIPGWHPQQYFSGAYLKFKDDQVTDMIEKPGAGNEPSTYAVSLGHFIFDSDVLIEALKRTTSEQDDIYEKAVTSLMHQSRFVMHPYGGPFASLKYPWHVLDVTQQLLTRGASHEGISVEIKQGVVIEGNVWLGDHVKIFENSKIVGPCYIGDNSVIGNNSIVRASHVGANCVVGFNTDITRSYIGDDCWFHSNYIGDSVLEGNISMGSGAVLANLRLDEGEIFSSVKDARVSTNRHKLGAMIASNVRIGVNTSIMPGVKIGSNSQLGSGIVIDRDIPDSSFVVFSKSSMEIRTNTQKAPLPDREGYKKVL